MNQLYQFFYRETGVRRFNELISPRLSLFTGFPRNSIYHHLTNDDEELFQDPSKPWFRGYEKRLPFELVYRSDFIIGHPRVVPFVPQRLTLPFVKKYNAFRYIPNALRLSVDQRTLIIINYNALKYTYRYFHTPVSDYQKWESIQRTFWNGVSKAALETNRQQFVIIEHIKEIPSFNMLNNYADKEGLTLVRLFNNHDKRFILHLTNFLRHEYRDKSVFNVIDLKALSNINLVFLLKDGRCSTINLAYLYSWVKGDENVSTIRISQQRDEKQFVRAILKYFLVLSAEQPDDAKEIINTPHEIIEQDRLDVQSQDSEDENNNQNNELIETSNPNISFINKNNEVQPAIIPVETVDEVKEFSTNIDDSIDEDLEILENKNKEDLYKRGFVVKDHEIVEINNDNDFITHETIHEEIYKSKQPNEKLIDKINNALDIGTLNAATYKRALLETTKYEKSLDPYGTNKPIKDQIVIDPEATNLKLDKTNLVKTKTTFDSSMDKSTLQTFTRDYISDHLRKDILKMIGGLQSGGVIIQDHEINIEHNITGASEQHRLELKPLNGVSSTVWFKLPLVEHDGSFKVGGNKYMMRKQRVD